jgi:hypothetical protein
MAIEPLYSGCWTWESAAVPVRPRLVNPRGFRRAAVLAAASPALAGAAGWCGSVPAGHEPTGTVSGTRASGWRVIRGAPVRSVIVIAPGETFARRRRGRSSTACRRGTSRFSVAAGDRPGQFPRTSAINSAC